MIKVENVEVWGFEHAIHGMRNPMNSWGRSDSHYCDFELTEDCDKCGALAADNTGECLSEKEFYCVGENDLGLMQKLFKAGTEHRKYLRQIFISMDITAPLYWWKEYDTYKVGTVANSCSTMHKIAAKEFARKDFSTENLDAESLTALDNTIHRLNVNRESFNVLKDKQYWWQMIQLLPTSYNQRRTVTMDYENVFSIIRQRSGHKLDEWREFVAVLMTLPYVKEIGGFDDSQMQTTGKEQK